MRRHLYFHGFASGPRATKAVAFADHLGPRGIEVVALDLRVPSFEHLRLTAMIDAGRAALGAPDDRAVIIGSSLGGLTAARVAEREPRVAALVLLAPAFQIAARWAADLGPDAMAAWQRTGWREVMDLTTNRPARVDYDFYRDLEAVDVGFPALEIPVLIIHGTGDDTVPIENSRAFVAAHRARSRAPVTLIEVEDDHRLVGSLPRIFDETDRLLATL